MRIRLLSLAIVATTLIAAPAVAQSTATPFPEPEAFYAPTPQPVVEAMLALARVTARDVVYDLGSGDGRIPITAALEYGAHGVGIDIDPRLVEEANANRTRAGVVDKVKFLNQDLFTTDISEATVVTLYLLPSLNLRLLPTLKKLRPGTRIVSHMFDMGRAWPPDETQKVEGRLIYRWTVQSPDPARRR